MSAEKGDPNGVPAPSSVRSPSLPDRGVAAGDRPSIGAQIAAILDLVGLSYMTLAEAGALVETRRRGHD